MVPYRAGFNELRGVTYGMVDEKRRGPKDEELRNGEVGTEMPKLQNGRISISLRFHYKNRYIFSFSRPAGTFLNILDILDIPHESCPEAV